MLDIIATIFLCFGCFAAGLVLQPVIVAYLTKPVEDDLEGEDYGC